MRFGVVTPRLAETAELKSFASMAERVGFDFIWVRQGADTADWPDALIASIAMADVAQHARFVVQLPLGKQHPLLDAEALAAADQAMRGRLELAVRPVSAGESEAYGADPKDALHRMTEALDVLKLAWTCRPFSHTGRTWRIPSNLEQNEGASDAQVQLTCRPNQVELPIWHATFPADSPEHSVSSFSRQPAGSNYIGTLAERSTTEEWIEAVLQTIQLNGKAMFCQFDPNNQQEAMMSFGQKVAPRFRNVRLPDVIVDALNS